MHEPILLIEDNDLDAYIAKQMLAMVDDSCNVKWLPNGMKAIEYLLDKKNTFPSVIILDLNMPLMNGIEFLEAIRKNETLKNLVITVLTSSMEINDVKFCEEYGVLKYFLKPLDESTSKEIINLAKVA